MNRLETIFETKVNANPQRTAILFEGTELSRQDLWDLALKCEETLRQAGFEKGCRIVTLLPNCPTLLAIALAVWKLGGAIVPLTANLGKATLFASCQLLDPFAVITTEGTNQSLELGQHIPSQIVTLADLTQPLPAIQHRETRKDQLPYAVIFATSGTTGNPKAVPLTHENIIHNIYATAEHVHLIDDEDLTILNLLPNYHTFGLCVSGILPLVLGYCQYMLPGFLPPKRALDAIYSGKVSVLIAVPTLYAMLSEGILKAGLPQPPALKRLICGGSATPPRVYEKTLQALGLPIHEGYGLTECSPIVASVHDPKDGKPEIIGPFLKGYEIELRDLNNNKVEGNEGVLWVKGPSVCGGYYLMPQAEMGRFDGPWFNTGDVVRLHDDGTLSIIDRSNDIIIVSGFNVYPQEIENLLMTYPGIAECAVVGSPNSISGEIPVAYVKMQDQAEADEKAMLRWLKNQLPPYKTPRKINFCAELPHNAMGKVLRRALRDQERSAKKK